MMDSKLIKKLEPLEEKFDCSLLTEDEALEFIKSDLEEIIKALDHEINLVKHVPEAKSWIYGIETSKNIIKMIIDSRIELGF